jgi:hypothetical protein
VDRQAVKDEEDLLAGILHQACQAAEQGGRIDCAIQHRPAQLRWDLPRLSAGATSLPDVTVTGARVCDLAQASLATNSGFFELDATAWSNNTVRVLARNVSNTTTDLAATLSVQVTKRRVL